MGISYEQKWKLYAKLCHSESAHVMIADSLASRLLSDDEKHALAAELAEKIGEPVSLSNREQALLSVFGNDFTASTLAEDAFCERALEAARLRGCRQCFLYGAGYRAHAFRHTGDLMHFFEIDKADVLLDKCARLRRAGLSLPRVSYLPCDLSSGAGLSSLGRHYTPAPSFNSLLGVSRRMEADRFRSLIATLSGLIAAGSDLVLDYRTRPHPGDRYGVFTDKEAETLLQENGFSLYEKLGEKEMTNAFFYPCPTLSAPADTVYLLAVKH